VSIDFRDALIALAPGLLLIFLPVCVAIAFSFGTAGCIDVKIPDEIHVTHDVNVRLISDTGDTSARLDT